MHRPFEHELHLQSESSLHCLPSSHLFPHALHLPPQSTSVSSSSLPLFPQVNAKKRRG
ncbi:unnamed protein product, partial [Rotaria sp. Silwood2]